MSDQSPGQVEATLAERGKRYGKFEFHANITQQLKAVMQNCPNWDTSPRLSPSMKESLEMIAHKIGRVLNGDPCYADSWVDIAGYAQLIVNELQEAAAPAPPCPVSPEAPEVSSDQPTGQAIDRYLAELLPGAAPLCPGIPLAAHPPQVICLKAKGCERADRCSHAGPHERITACMVECGHARDATCAEIGEVTP